MIRKSLIAASALAALLSLGCCQTQTCAPTKTTCSGEVRGEVVYRLNGGITTNSNAVRLAGSTGSFGCIPCSAWGGRQITRYADRFQEAPGQAPATLDSLPRSQQPCQPATFTSAPSGLVEAPLVSTPLATNCQPVVGALPDSFESVVCAPNSNMSDCFVLPEQPETPAASDLQMPNGGILDVLGDMQTGSEVKQTQSAPDEPAAKSETPAAIDPIVKNDPIEKAADLPVTDIPEKAVEKAEQPSTTPAPEIKENVPETPLSSKAEIDEMPPVFREGTTDDAAEEILSTAKSPIDGLPQIELPPDL